MTWEPWKPSNEQPWDLLRVAHLHRRAGFAPDWSTIENSLNAGWERSLERLFDTTTNQAAIDQFEEMAQTIGDAAVGADSTDRLRAWWVYRLMMTPRPLVECMTLLWHNHFATSNDKVKNVAAMYLQNKLLRTHSLGKFGDLCKAIVKDPAMLIWLDASANRKEHPNENLARELMELFTLGEGHYTEKDVVEAARCLTGWTVSNGQFRFVTESHDSGEKKVLGRAVTDGDSLLDLLIGQAVTARRVAWRLCQKFFGENVVSDAMLNRLAQGLQEHELDLRWGVETILRSSLFFSDKNIRSRIASPVEYVLGTVRSLEMSKHPPSTLLLAEQLKKLGQDLFHPPNVFGWAEGESWINTRSIIARNHFAKAIVLGKMFYESNPLKPRTLANEHGHGLSKSSIAEFYSLLLGNHSRTDDGPNLELNRNLSDDDDLRSMISNFIASPEYQIN